MKKKFIISEDGFTLSSILMLILLATTLLFGFITLLTFYNSYNIKLTNKKTLDLACFSALQILLNNENELEEKVTVVKIDSVTVKLVKSANGVFTEIESTAIGFNDSSKIKYLIANKIEPPFNNAVVISKDRLRAAVAGKTSITGNMLLTTDKVKIGRITGVSSASKDYLDGELKINENIETKLLDERILLSIFKYFEINENANYISNNFDLNATTITKLSSNRINVIEGDLYIRGNIRNNKKSEKCFISVKGQTTIEENSIVNKDMQITSDSSIIVEENVNLGDIILATENKIEVGENTYGKNVQLFAKKGVSISGSLFEYPTVIGLYTDSDEESNFKNKLEISSSIINGSILLVCSTVGLPKNKSIITIDDQSKVHGLIYSENNADISGYVNGIIYTYSFWYYKEPTEYINWLVNVNVDSKKLDTEFLLPVGFKGINEMAILKETWTN